MSYQTELTRERLLQLFVYDPGTGKLWRKQRNGLREIKTKVGQYTDVCVDYVSYKLHHLIWFLETGRLPEKILDHRDGDQTNNRIGNLREVTHQENSQNRRSQNRGRLCSDLPIGVYPEGSRRGIRYTARIFLNGKLKYLGVFDTPEEAYQVHLAARREHYPGNTL